LTPDTIEIQISEALKHSKLGIASCLIAVFVYIYFFVMGWLLIYGLGDIFPKDANADVAILGAVVGFFIHLAVCSVGFIVGLVFSGVSLVQKDRKRIFAVLGLILNILPLVVALIFTGWFFYK
jgi:hypothetical protein